MGAFKAKTYLAVLIASGMVLGAAYALWLYRRVVFGELVKEDLLKMPDLTIREWGIFLPLVVSVLWLGIYPKPFLSAMHMTVQHLIMQVGGAHA
jgi:NADH-quinone oxidoreductase subunit M